MTQQPKKCMLTKKSVVLNVNVLGEGEDYYDVELGDGKPWITGRVKKCHELDNSLVPQMQRYIGEWAKRKGWWDTEKERSIVEQIALMHSELSEAVEALREDNPPAWADASNDLKPEGWAIELADCVIRIMDTLFHYGIDLEQLIKQKMKYNESRPYRHGGKKL